MPRVIAQSYVLARNLLRIKIQLSAALTVATKYSQAVAPHVLTLAQPRGYPWCGSVHLSDSKEINDATTCNTRVGSGWGQLTLCGPSGSCPGPRIRPRN